MVSEAASAAVRKSLVGAPQASTAYRFSTHVEILQRGQQNAQGTYLRSSRAARVARTAPNSQVACSGRR